MEREIEKTKNIIRTTLMKIIWNIWLEKNRKILYNSHLNFNLLCAKIKSFIAFWTDNTGDETRNTSSTRPIRNEIRRRLN